MTQSDGNTALARVDHSAPLAKTDPYTEWKALREQAAELVRSGFLPRAVNTAEKAIAIIQTGRELGIGPMQALRAIHIIEGKPTMSAELIAGLVLARIPGALLHVAKTTNEECVVRAARPGQPPTEYRFTIADARAAGIAGKDNWKKYPRAMLRARALSEAARGTFPDASMGLYDPDELGAVTNEQGSVVQLPEAAASAQKETESPANNVLRAIDEAASLDELRGLWSSVLELKNKKLVNGDTYKMVVAEYKHRGELLQQDQVAAEEAHYTPDEPDDREPGSDG